MDSVNTAEFQTAIDPGVRKHFVLGYKQLASNLEKVFDMDTQESETDVYKNYTGLGQFTAVGEGQNYDTDAPLEAYGVSLTPTKYGKAMKITYEMQKWSKVKDILNASRHLGDAARRTAERKGASVLNNSQDTDYTSYTDTKPLGSTSHTRADGGTAQSNASATGIVFDEDNLETALLAMEMQLDDRGELIDVFGKSLVVPPALRKQALIVTRSGLRSETANNDPNVYTMEEYNGSIGVLVWKYLAAAAGGSDTRWFLMDKALSRLMWNWAEKPGVSVDKSIGFMNDTIMYKGRYYAAFGWGDWRGCWISAGDGAAYSD